MRALLPHHLLDRRDLLGHARGQDLVAAIRESGYEDPLDIVLNGLECHSRDEPAAPLFLRLEHELVNRPLGLGEPAAHGDSLADVRRVASHIGPDIEDDQVARSEHAGRGPEMDLWQICHIQLDKIN